MRHQQIGLGSINFVKDLRNQNIEKSLLVPEFAFIIGHMTEFEGRKVVNRCDVDVDGEVFLFRRDGVLFDSRGH